MEISKVLRIRKLENHIYALAKTYRKKWKEELWKSKDIEKFGLNEFWGGKADAFEECLFLIRKYSGISDSENSVFIQSKKQKN